MRNTGGSLDVFSGAILSPARLPISPFRLCVRSQTYERTREHSEGLAPPQSVPFGLLRPIFTAKYTHNPAPTPPGARS